MPKQTIFLEIEVFLILLRIFDGIFDIIIDDPYLTYLVERLCLWRHLALWPCFRRILGEKVYVGYWSGFMQGSKENKQLMRQKKVYIQCSNVCIMGLKLFWSRIWCCGRSAGISNILVGSTGSSSTSLLMHRRHCSIANS